MHRTRTALALAALTAGLTPFALPASGADPVWSGSARAALVDLSVGTVLLPSGAVAGSVAPVTATAGSARSDAVAANVTAGLLGAADVDLLLSSTQTAPETAPTAASASLLDLPLSPVLTAGVERTTARARSSATECLTGEPVAAATSTVADLDLLEGTAALAGPAPGGLASSQARVDLVRTTGDAAAVVASSQTSVTSLSLLGGAVEVEVVEPLRVTATATGTPGGATFEVDQPELTVNGSPVVDGQQLSGLGVPLAPVVELGLGRAEQTAATPDGRSAGGTAVLLSLDLVGTRGQTLATVEVGRTTVQADAPAGGVSCPPAADADGDGLTEQEEQRLGTDPAVADTDGDGLPDGAETSLGTDPAQADTDGDGTDDGAEVDRGSDPTSADDTGSAPPLDSDGDGLSDLDELAGGTDPNRRDTDGDGLSDGAEVNTVGSDPLRPDTDGDGLTDGAEVTVHRTDPVVADTDGDGLTDGAEVTTHRTDPDDPDTDDGGVPDGTEVQRGSDPLDPADDGSSRSVAGAPDGAAGPLDTDRGGVPDDVERADGTDPLQACDDRGSCATTQGRVLARTGAEVLPGAVAAALLLGAVALRRRTA